MITVHDLNSFKLGNAGFQIAHMLGYATLHGLEFGLTEPWKFQHYFKNPLPLLKSKPSKIYTEKQFHYYELPVMLDVAFAGYWQSWKRFSHCLDLVKYYFAVADEWVEKALTSSNMDRYYPSAYDAIVHVRLTDYRDFSEYHTNLDRTNYYTKALHLLQDYVSAPSILVCSDDTDCCKTKSEVIQYFNTDYSVHFSADTNDIIDLYYMTQAKTLIIANSSFSALAAFLNSVKDKTIYAPKQWFGPKGPTVWSDIYHPDWILI